MNRIVPNDNAANLGEMTNVNTKLTSALAIFITASGTVIIIMMYHKVSKM